MLKYLYLSYQSVKGVFNSAFFVSILNYPLTLAFLAKAELPANSLITQSHSQKPTQTNRNTICHYICQAMIIVIILQSCKLIILHNSLTSYAVHWHLINLLVHLCAFWWVLYLSQNDKFSSARTLLITGFCSYLSAACLLWQFDLNVQYYFLLGLFISSYLIDSHEKFLLVFCLAFQLIAFIGFSLWLPKLDNSQYDLLSIAHTNTLIFAASCCICALFIRSILSRNWQQMHVYKARQKQLINLVFPNHMGIELLSNLSSTNLNCADTNYLSQKKHMAILFLDICDFTQGLLNNDKSWQETYSLFARFDDLIKHLDTKRVKTNGDQYILVIGMQNPLLSASEIAEQALTTSILIANFCEQEDSVKVRQGLSFGEVIYGIFDTNNPVFDIWGETVVTAARLEAIAKANNIMVDRFLYQLTREKFSYAPAVNVALKGIGNISTYSVIR